MRSGGGGGDIDRKDLESSTTCQTFEDFHQEMRYHILLSSLAAAAFVVLVWAVWLSVAACCNCSECFRLLTCGVVDWVRGTSRRRMSLMELFEEEQRRHKGVVVTRVGRDGRRATRPETGTPVLLEGALLLSAAASGDSGEVPGGSQAALTQQVNEMKRTTKALEEALKRKTNEIHEMEERYQKYIEKAKVVIRALDLKQSNSPPEVTLLREQLIDKQRLIERLEGELDRVKASADFEQRVISSSFHNLGAQLHRGTVDKRLGLRIGGASSEEGVASGAGAGISFLGRQRMTNVRRGLPSLVSGPRSLPSEHSVGVGAMTSPSAPSSSKATPTTS
ncbi:unnamed protein product [Cyprideis torosa]|uniref:Uncharacterized protein n=1 Tax=Cyprideis torosa TaxID=163714 RepID=A0A7R8WCI6_9CRUS|nr:unnamed protein product [Cyprideis torosa]CAG0893497.1 unnamed protein product [Cyprideis torosa]